MGKLKKLGWDLYGTGLGANKYLNTEQREVVTDYFGRILTAKVSVTTKSKPPITAAYYILHFLISTLY